YFYGGDGNDALIGQGGVDVFIAGIGDDVMDGGAEGDYFYGEDGNDTGIGGAGNDIFVMVAGNDTANGDDGQDYFYMGFGDDVINGGAGVDVMLGEAGNDTFNGGLGVDYLFLGPGGAGDNDTVIVDKTNTGVEVVYNFEAGGANDTIRLTGTGWTNFQQVQAAITDYTASGAFCVLTLDADTSVWLIGVQPSQLTAADFAFA
ncbi:MAG: calcium-binding protein, partial [Bradyrhizobium guangdongense]